MEEQLNLYNALKDTLENFQKNVSKDLQQIIKCKREVQNYRDEVIDRYERGKYFRDDHRIILSAPEVIIGDVDSSGRLFASAGGTVVVRGRSVSLEGVGSGADSYGTVTTRAASIRQEAVDPGIDGTDRVVKNVSEVVSQARGITLKTEDAEGWFPTQQVGAMRGVTISTDTSVSVEATMPCERREAVLKEEEKSVSDEVKALETEMKTAQKTVTDMLKKLDDIVKNEVKDDSLIDVRTNKLDIDEWHAEFNSTSASLYQSMMSYFGILSRLAEMNRRAECIKTQKEELSKNKSTYKTKPHGTGISMASESISIISADGDGNLRENQEAGFRMAAPRVKVTTYDNKGGLNKDSGIYMASKNIELNTADVKATESKSDLPAVGKVNIVSKEVNIEAVDYEISKGKQTETCLTKDGNVRVRAEHVSFQSTDTDGKSTGTFEANAKSIELKSMDTDKEKGTDKALAASGSIVAVADKLLVGSKDKKLKSKTLQLASDKLAAIGDTTVELQQKKAVVQLDGGDLGLAGGKTNVFGDTTVNGKTTFKSDVAGETIDMKNMKVKSSFKSPYTSEGVAVPGAPSTAKLNPKLEEQEIKKEEKK